MKRFIFSIIFLTTLTSYGQDKIKGFIHNYFDTSSVVKDFEAKFSYNPEYLEKNLYLPDSFDDYTFDVGEYVKTDAYLSYEIIDPLYEDKLNTARTGVGSDPLERNDSLDSLALIRCLSMIDLVLDDNGYYTYPEALLDPHKGHFEKTGENFSHTIVTCGDSKNPEYCTDKSQFIGFERNRWNIDKKFKSKEHSCTAYYRNAYQTKYVYGIDRSPYDASTALNDSPPHYKNRTNKHYTKYGTKTILVETFMETSDGPKTVTFILTYEILI